MRLSAHTVYIPREHIVFLEEWLDYHIAQGVDHFYMYDNTGSIGDKLSSYKNVNQTGKCKRGYDIGSITNKLTDDQINEIQFEIFNKYPGKVTHMMWPPREPGKTVYYMQNPGIRHCIVNNVDKTDWLYCLDIDELFFSPAGITLRECVNIIDDLGYSAMAMTCRNFLNRYLNTPTGETKIRNRYQSQIFQYGGSLPQCPKNVLRVKDVDTHSGKVGIHWVSLKQESLKTRKGGTKGWYPFLSRQVKSENLFAQYNHYNLPDDWVKDPTTCKRKGHWFKKFSKPIRSMNPDGMESLRTDDSLSKILLMLQKREMVIDKYIDIKNYI